MRWEDSSGHYTQFRGAVNSQTIFKFLEDGRRKRGGGCKYEKLQEKDKERKETEKGNRVRSTRYMKK